MNQNSVTLNILKARANLRTCKILPIMPTRKYWQSMKIHKKLSWILSTVERKETKLPIMQIKKKIMAAVMVATLRMNWPTWVQAQMKTIRMAKLLYHLIMLHKWRCSNKENWSRVKMQLEKRVGWSWIYLCTKKCSRSTHTESSLWVIF